MARRSVGDINWLTYVPEGEKAAIVENRINTG
jgi:hypothetical protein